MNDDIRNAGRILGFVKTAEEAGLQLGGLPGTEQMGPAAGMANNFIPQFAQDAAMAPPAAAGAQGGAQDWWSQMDPQMKNYLMAGMLGGGALGAGMGVTGGDKKRSWLDRIGSGLGQGLLGAGLGAGAGYLANEYL